MKKRGSDINQHGNKVTLQGVTSGRKEGREAPSLHDIHDLGQRRINVGISVILQGREKRG